MANLGSNSLWSNIGNKASNVKNDIIGPDYSYADQIQGTSSQGIGGDGTFSQLGRNFDGVMYYVNQLITGDPPLGNQFFVNTGGTCTAPDNTIQSRYNYINNVSSGAASLPSALSEIGSDFNGLIPGMVDDIEGLNPLYIFNSMIADASPPCSCYSCPVTAGGTQTQFLSPELTADLSSSACTIVDPSNCKSTTESFSNRDDTTKWLLVPLLGLAFVAFKTFYKR
jgi:hypothetical protein